MEGEESEDRQAVVDALVDAVGQRDALLTFFWLERDPAALSLPGSTSGLTALETAVIPVDLDEPPAVLARLQNAHRLIIQVLLLDGPDAELVRASPARDLENWLRQSGFDRETEPVCYEAAGDSGGAKVEEDAIECDERAVKVERVDAAMSLDQDDASPLDAALDLDADIEARDVKPTLATSASSTPFNFLPMIELLEERTGLQTLWTQVGVHLRRIQFDFGPSFKAYITEAEGLGLVKTGNIVQGKDWVALLWAGGLPPKSSDLERRLSNFLGGYLDADQIWSITIHSLSGTESSFAHIRLDPRFDATAFERKFNHKLQFEHRSLLALRPTVAKTLPLGIISNHTDHVPAPALPSDDDPRSVDALPLVTVAPSFPPPPSAIFHHAPRSLSDNSLDLLHSLRIPSPRIESAPDPPSAAGAIPLATAASASPVTGAVDQDLATYPSNIPPATFWDPHLFTPTPSFTRTISVPTTFGYVPSDLASRVLSDPSTLYPSDPVRRAQLVAFLESQRDGTQTEHYDAFLRQVEDFSERNREFMKFVEDFRGKERRREEEPSSEWQRMPQRSDERRAAKWGPD
ncbi:hypothetical protein RQP46_006758 [Phenoliferia psychrophenolica]